MSRYVKCTKPFGCLLLAMIIWSGSTSAATIWSSWTQIEEIYPSQSVLIFYTTTYAHELSTCNNGKRFSLDPNLADYKVQAAALMSAFLSNKYIVMAFEDTQPANCHIIINRFRVRRQ